MRTNGAVAVVTGASSGIGRATALRLARKGTHVVLAARRRAALESVARECERHGVRALVVPTDVTDPAAVTALAERAVATFGRIDVWVNNASVGVFAPFLRAPLDDVRRVLDVNIMGYVYGARAALRQMHRQGSGVLVNVGSVAGVVAQPYTAPYAMSKAAVRALGTSLRSELMLAKQSGITVVTVLPAAIDTPFFHHAANYTGRRVRPMPPVYSAERVARAIVGAVRRPRPEVFVGPIGRQVNIQHKALPGTTDAVMAVHTEKGHLSRKQAPATTGALYEPRPDTATVSGGWGGRRRTAQRRIAVAGALTGAGLLARRLMRGAPGR